MFKIAIALVLVNAAVAATPTYNKDVAPILNRNCANCHRPGEVAPFPLLSYSDASKRASLIAAVTAKRYMPPWKAEPGYGHFEDERRLSDAEIATIGAWAKAGAPEGDARHKPAPPQFTSGWQAGKPDAVFTVAQPFSLPPDGRDVFQCFVVPLGFDGERHVKTVEFRPGNARVVHHALFFLDSSGEARTLDNGKGYSCFGGPQVLVSGGLGGWAPGATPTPLPAGVAQTVQPGTDLVIQIHYHPSGKPETDQSSIGLTFGEAPIKGLASVLVGTRKIDLPAGAANQEITDSAVLPQDVDVIGITPHAHLLCKEMKVDALLPDGTNVPLIWIKDWDFNWQGQYQYAAPVRLPKGTRIAMRYVYDNSAANPHNPSSPPKRVKFGEQTTDEMALVFLRVVLPHPEDARRFRREFAFERVKQYVTDGGEPMGFSREITARLRSAIAAFDRNHDGKLDAEERAALFRVLAERFGGATR